MHRLGDVTALKVCKSLCLICLLMTLLPGAAGDSMAPMQGYNTIAPPGYDATASSVSLSQLPASQQEATSWRLSIPQCQKDAKPSSLSCLCKSVSGVTAGLSGKLLCERFATW